MYAVIETGGKQYRVKEGDVLEIEKLAVEAGETVSIDKVLMVGAGEEVSFGTPYVEGAAVELEVQDQFRGKKVVAFKYKRRKQYSRTVGHRQSLTRVVVKSIKSA